MMKCEFKEVRIRDLIAGYVDSGDDGVIGYGGNLNIRPEFQREFVYKDEMRSLVIDTISRNLPLGELYWSDNNNGTFEVIDGQQRICSICQFAEGRFGVEINGVFKYFDGLSSTELDTFLNHKLHVYFCNGSSVEKMQWFEIINKQGMKLTKQELLNSSYTGRWLTDAKRYFSKGGCVAYKLSNRYIKGSPIRQEVLEKALYWISNGNIVEYMAKHQNDEDSIELWNYFNGVVEWIDKTFITYRKEAMIGVEFGLLYNKFSCDNIDPQKLELKIKKLMQDDDVSYKRGIYSYVLDGNESRLNIRCFDDSIKRSVYEHQNGICNHCNESFEYSDMQGDHITPWSKGGKTNIDNLQMLCDHCNRIKSNK